LRRLRQTMRLAHWSVCPSQVAPMTRGSVDLDDSVHRVCVCDCVDSADGKYEVTYKPNVVVFYTGDVLRDDPRDRAER